MEQVLALNPDVTLYAARTGWTVAVRHPDGAAPPEIFDVNGTAKEVLGLVDGRRTTRDIATCLCTAHGLDADEHVDWVETFLADMRRRHVVVPATGAAPTGLTVLGDTDRLWPSHVTLEVTATCNLTCQHCYLDASPHNRTHIPLDALRRLVDDLVRRHVLTVELTGGEFFMHPDAVEVLELAYARFAKVGLLTNATHVPERALDLMAAHADRTVVGVSLDSARPELHDRWRGGRGAFAKTCANVRRMADRGLAVRIGVTIFEENRWELDDMAHLAVSLGARLFGFSFVEDAGRGTERPDDQQLRFDAEYDAYVSSVTRKYADLIPVVPLEDTRAALGNCGAGSRAVTIGADGTMRPCNLFPGSLVIGDALHGGWDTVPDLDLPARLAAIPVPNLEHGCPRDCPSLTRCWGCYLKGLRANVGRAPADHCAWVRRHDLADLVERSAPPREPVLVPLGRR